MNSYAISLEQEKKNKRKARRISILMLLLFLLLLLFPFMSGKLQVEQKYDKVIEIEFDKSCLLYTSPSPRDS